jgi:hypothetical protein
VFCKLQFSAFRNASRLIGSLPNLPWLCFSKRDLTFGILNSHIELIANPHFLQSKFMAPEPNGQPGDQIRLVVSSLLTRAIISPGTLLVARLAPRPAAKFRLALEGVSAGLHGYRPKATATANVERSPTVEWADPSPAICARPLSRTRNAGLNHYRRQNEHPVIQGFSRHPPLIIGKLTV